MVSSAQKRPKQASNSVAPIEESRAVALDLQPSGRGTLVSGSAKTKAPQAKCLKGVVCQNRIRRGLDDQEGAGPLWLQCPSRSLSSAPFVPRSRRTGIWYSRTWRSANNLPCSAIGRSDHNSDASIASSGCGCPPGGPGGV